MPYKVSGAKKSSGEDVSITCHTESEDAAIGIAQSNGIVVESVEYVAPVVTQKDYHAVELCGYVLMVVGVLAMLAGGVSVLVVIQPGRDNMASGIAYGFSIAFIGLFQLGLGSLLHMLRDTAIHIQSK